MKDTKYNDPNAKNELDFLNEYQKKGYTANFRVEENMLIATGEDLSFEPKQVHIVAQHRYEGMSNPSDQAILYVLEASEGCKGTMINGYGPAANLDVHEFIESIPKENVSHKDSILNL